MQILEDISTTANLETSFVSDVHLEEIIPTVSQLTALKLLKSSQTILSTNIIFPDFVYKNDTLIKCIKNMYINRHNIKDPCRQMTSDSQISLHSLTSFNIAFI